MERGQRGSGLRLVSNRLPWPPRSLQMLQPLGSQFARCLFKTRCLPTGTSCSQHLDLGPRCHLTGRSALCSLPDSSFQVQDPHFGECSKITCCLVPSLNGKYRDNVLVEVCIATAQGETTPAGSWFTQQCPFVQRSFSSLPSGLT